MRILFFGLIAVTLGTTSNGYAQKVSLDEETDASRSEVQVDSNYDVTAPRVAKGIVYEVNQHLGKPIQGATISPAISKDPAAESMFSN